MGILELGILWEEHLILERICCERERIKTEKKDEDGGVDADDDDEGEDEHEL